MTNSSIATAVTSNNLDIITTLATCWKIKTRNNKVLCFTDHDKDLEIDGDLYSANSGIDSSAIANSSTMIPDNFDLEGIIDNSAIHENELLAGVYDHAEVITFFINYSNPQEKLQLKRGWLGEVRMNGSTFFVEVRGLLQSMDKCVGSLYSTNCRAKFGDQKCGVDLNLYKSLNEVNDVINLSNFTVMLDIPKNQSFAQGKVMFVSGANLGNSMEIKFCTGNMIKLVLDMPMNINKGDKIEVFAGCDKNFTTCYERYNNAINFRGEPDISAKSALDVLQR